MQYAATSYAHDSYRSPLCLGPDLPVVYATFSVAALALHASGLRVDVLFSPS